MSQKKKWKKARPLKQNKLQELLGMLEQAKDVLEKQKEKYEDDLSFLEKAAADMKPETQNA
jgi:hypothetical protein